MNIEELVNHYFEDEHYNCAQAAALSICDVCGLDKNVLAKAMNGFGGGIAGTRNTCGGLTGAIAAIGYATNDGEGRTRNAAGYAATNKLCQEMFADFENEFGTVHCGQLTGAGRGDEETRKAFMANGGHARVCSPCVLFAVKRALEIIESAK